MRRLTELVMEHVNALPEGKTICARELLHLGSRAALDQALCRLARRGQLFRAGRGLYLRFVESRFGKRTPSPEKVVESLSTATGEVIARHGGASANSLGLTTQVPVRSIYLTTGPNKRIQLGRQTIELRHTRSLIQGQAGDVIRALVWLGRENGRESLVELKRKLPANVLHELTAARPSMPTWMAQLVSELVA